MMNANPINLDQKDINQSISLSGRLIVQRYGILTTPFVAYVVWEPTVGVGEGGHSHKTRIEGKWYGNITTRRLPAYLDAFPAFSEERRAAVQAWHRDLEEWEERIIRVLFPQDFVETEEKGATEV